MMIWHDSWQYVITWHTSHDVKAWLHKHEIWHLTSSMCRCEWTGAMIYFCFARYLGLEIHSNYRRLVTFTYAFTRDLETKGHIMVYVTFVISACICITAMIFLLFHKDFRSGNLFQLSSFAWPSRLSLKLNVTSWSTWHMSFLPVFVLPQWFGLFRKVFGSGNSFQLLPLAWLLRMTLELRITTWSTWHVLFLGTCMCPTAMIFCFVRFSVQGIHSDYCHLRDHHVWPWNVRSRHGLRALTTWQNKKTRRQWRDLRFSRSSVKITQLAKVRMNSLNQNLTKHKKQSSR